MSETAAINLEFERMPSVYWGFARAAVARRKPLQEGQSIPAICARLQQVRAEALHLRRYREVCGFSVSDNLPLTFPHVLAAPLHMALMTHRQFPLRLAGAVHLRNRIEQHRPIAATEPLQLAVHAEGHREVEQGLEFDLVTQAASSQGEDVWHGTSTYLVRTRRQSGNRRKPSPTPDPAGFTAEDEWRVDAGLGRRYGLIAGDINPIHLHQLLARPFGFPRAIAHGMWSYARCAAALVPMDMDDHVSLDVTFRRPILLPSVIVLRTARGSDDTYYMVTDATGQTLHLNGTLVIGRR